MEENFIVYYDFKRFREKFNRLGRFVAVKDWRSSRDLKYEEWLIIVEFENSRKVRFASKDLKCLPLIMDLIEQNKLLHTK